VEQAARLDINAIVVSLHMSFTAGPRDNPNVYIIGNTSFKYPARKAGPSKLTVSESVLKAPTMVSALEATI